MNTSTVPGLEQLDFFRGLSGTKIRPQAQTTSRSYPKEKDVLKQVGALYDPPIIEAVNLFKPEVQDVIWEYTGEDQ
jgi:hypothetical protein